MSIIIKDGHDTVWIDPNGDIQSVDFGWTMNLAKIEEMRAENEQLTRALKLSSKTIRSFMAQLGA